MTLESDRAGHQFFPALESKFFGHIMLPSNPFTLKPAMLVICRLHDQPPQNLAAENSVGSSPTFCWSSGLSWAVLTWRLLWGHQETAGFRRLQASEGSAGLDGHITHIASSQRWLSAKSSAGAVNQSTFMWAPSGVLASPSRAAGFQKGACQEPVSQETKAETAQSSW